jgi:hypothetical protein
MRLHNHNGPELSPALVFGRKPVPRLYGGLKRFSRVEIAPQPLFNESAMRIEDVDHKRIAFNKLHTSKGIYVLLAS